MNFPPLVRVILSCLVSSLLIGCAGSGGTSGIASASPPSKVSVAVRQFSSPDYNKLSAGDRGLRDFEHIYLPGKLTDRLRGSGQCSGAYFCTGTTSATDLVVDGEVVESNGKDLSLKITVTRIDGKTVLSKKYDVSHEDARPAYVKGALTNFTDRIAGDVIAAGLKSNISLDEARFHAYAGGGKVAKDESKVKDAAIAGEIERSEILTPLTDALIPRSRIAEGPYVEWISLSAPLQDDNEAATHQRNAAIVSGGLGVAAGALSAASSYESARQGNTAGVTQANQNLASATAIVTEAAGSAQVASNRLAAIANTLAAYKNTFAIGATRQVTIRIYDKMVKVSGNQAEQLSEFRAVVKEKLLSTSAATASN